MAGIAHTGPGGVAVSAFGYGYDAGGSITQWTQSQPFHTVEPMSAWTIEQDAADQLTGVSVEGRAVGRQVFSYDLAGNRLTAQSGNATSTTAYNALNQITGISGGGRLRFSGTTSEAANVSVQGRAARMLDATTFTADAEVVPGVNTIPVVATDGNGNRRTNNYQVTVTGGATRAFVYDGLGNLLDDGERTYQWDAKNRLIEAKKGADTWQWSYNAFDQRVSEKKNGVVTKRWVWAGGNQPAEERDAAGNVTRRFYPQGEQAGAVKYFYTKDHLGSIREVLGANGTVVSSSRYDAWGVRTTVGAQDAASFGFTGHLEHKELGLVFTLYRAYDSATGRWLSRDPMGEDGGINLYGYVSNSPVDMIDPDGLWQVTLGAGYGFAAKLTFGFNEGKANFGGSLGYGIGLLGEYSDANKDPNKPSNADDCSKNYASIGLGISGSLGLGPFASMGAGLSSTTRLDSEGNVTNSTTLNGSLTLKGSGPLKANLGGSVSSNIHGNSDGSYSGSITGSRSSMMRIGGMAFGGVSAGGSW